MMQELMSNAINRRFFFFSTEIVPTTFSSERGITEFNVSFFDVNLLKRKNAVRIATNKNMAKTMM